jgi:rhodanese-related sulfurtransferase
MQTALNQNQDPARARAFFEDKLAFTTGPVELDRMIKAGEKITVVDVREGEDFARGHIPGAINLPSGTWERPPSDLQDTLVVYCYTQTCHLAAKACLAFAGQGRRVMEMEGGFKAWSDADLEVEHGEANRLDKAGERMFNRRQ